MFSVFKCHKQFKIALEGLVHYTGQILAPAEGLGLLLRLFSGVKKDSQVENSLLTTKAYEYFKIYSVIKNNF